MAMIEGRRRAAAIREQVGQALAAAPARKALAGYGVSKKAVMR